MKRVLLFLLTLISTTLFAQSGSVDLSFSGFNGTIKVTKIQPDGKILLGGTFTSFNGFQQACLIRLNADGTRDTSFTFGTNPTTNAANLFVNAAQGDIDGTTPYVSVITLQPDGKILIGGNFTHIGNYEITRRRILRINANGTYDSTFTGWGFQNYPSVGVQPCKIKSIVLQPDGKILVGGEFTLYFSTSPTSNTSVGRIVRINTNGSIDTTFNTGNGFNGPVNCIIVQPDNKIIVAGDFTDYNGSPEVKMARLESDGVRDYTYNTSDNLVNSPLKPKVLTLLPDGVSALIGGDESPYIMHIASDGISYEQMNPHANNRVTGIVVKSDGKILISGDFTEYGQTSSNVSTQNRFVALNSDLSIDTKYNTGTGFNGLVESIQIDSNNKVWTSGEFTQYNGVNTTYAVRLNGNSTLSTVNYSKNKVTLYPNPAKDILNFTLSETNTAYEYEINNLLGEKVSYGNVNSNSISIINLANGVYIVKIRTNEGVLTEKFIKE